MPTYEFACQSCGKSFEELVWSSSEIDEIVCPQCGSRSVKRKVSGFAAIGGSRSGSRSSASSDASCAPGRG
jgi:putative FmdB family regulatory protein